MVLLSRHRHEDEGGVKTVAFLRSKNTPPFLPISSAPIAHALVIQ
jgi:hypothetical protein